MVLPKEEAAPRTHPPRGRKSMGMPEASDRLLMRGGQGGRPRAAARLYTVGGQVENAQAVWVRHRVPVGELRTTLPNGSAGTHTFLDSALGKAGEMLNLNSHRAVAAHT